jgi:hypothetical protein
MDGFLLSIIVPQHHRPCYRFFILFNEYVFPIRMYLSMKQAVRLASVFTTERIAVKNVPTLRSVFIIRRPVKSFEKRVEIQHHSEMPFHAA